MKVSVSTVLNYCTRMKKSNFTSRSVSLMVSNSTHLGQVTVGVKLPSQT